MAVILVLVCGVMSFVSAVAALLFMEVTLFQAFGLWMFGGFAAMVLALLPALLPRRSPVSDGAAETA
jgi:hypothetical protein